MSTLLESNDPVNSPETNSPSNVHRQRLLRLERLIAPAIGPHAAAELAEELAATRDVIDLQAAELHHLRERVSLLEGQQAGGVCE